MDLTSTPLRSSADRVPPGRPLAIEAAGLRRTYGRRVALDSLDLRVETGTVLGLLGPNGAGKTTAIRVLSTVLGPDHGTFTIAGIPHTDPTAIRQRVGVLPENAAPPGGQTAEEWLRYHSRLFGAGRRTARENASFLLSEVGLSDRAGSRVATLSRGQRQRLMIARALVNRPDVVFLDEPTLGLDPHGQRQVLALVARIARDRRATVVLSTHTLADVEEVCDRVVILNHGRIAAEGTVAEVVRQAAAPRGAVVRVPADLVERAVAALGARGVTAAAAAHGRPGAVELVLPTDLPLEDSATGTLRCLLDAGVPVLGLEVEGGRLSDAFLALTRGTTDA